MTNKPSTPLGDIQERRGYVCSDGFSTFDEREAVEHEIELVVGTQCISGVLGQAAVLQKLLTRRLEPRLNVTRGSGEAPQLNA